MIEDEKLKRYRNKVIERTNQTDMFVSCIIAKSYFLRPGIPIDFVSTVLYQQPLSFSSRINMLNNILKHGKKPNNKLINKLNKMSEIRNTFAHCGMKISFKGGDEYIFNVKDYTKPIDFEKLYQKFNELDEEVFPIVIAMFEKLEGKKLQQMKKP